MIQAEGIASNQAQNSSSGLNMVRATSAMANYLFQREVAFILEFVNTAARPIQVLEVGCGKGQITSALQEAGMQVTGIDIDRESLGVCRSRLSTVPLVEGMALSLPFTAESFDFLVAIECVGYFAHQPFLEESFRVLRNGGMLIFDSVNPSSYRSLLGRLFGRSRAKSLRGLLNRHSRVDHSQKIASETYFLNAREVLHIIDQVGFKTQAVSGYNWLPFDVRSNSRLVGPAALFEQALRLDRYYDLSPWVLVAASK